MTNSLKLSLAASAVLALAAGQALTGTAVAAEVRGKRVACTVTAMPFIPHRYVRKQGA